MLVIIIFADLRYVSVDIYIVISLDIWLRHSPCQRARVKEGSLWWQNLVPQLLDMSINIFEIVFLFR